MKLIHAVFSASGCALTDNLRIQAKPLIEMILGVWLANRKLPGRHRVNPQAAGFGRKGPYTQLKV